MILENMPIVWIAAAVILIGVEMFTGTFYLLVMSISCAAGALAAWLGAPLTLQIALAVLMAVAGAMLVWRRHKKHRAQEQPQDYNMEIGRTVVWQSSYPDGTWQVRYRGTQWQASPCHQGVDPQKTLVIVETQGNILLLDNIKEHSQQQS